MPYFLTDNFLLQSKSAQRLYHDHVRDLPIIDYHCHLSPGEIAADKQFGNLTDIWLRGDHYKWRAQRSLGVPEELITGAATDKDKFLAWAKVVPQTVRNPLFHWTHMELKKVFGIAEYLDQTNAESVYERCNALLSKPSHTTRSLLTSFKVEYVGTTDEPWDSLEHHSSLAAENFSVKVMPSFRPDKVLLIGNKDSFFQSLDLLAKSCNTTIKDIASLLEALQARVDFFHAIGCRVSDHGLSSMPGSVHFSDQLEKEFATFISKRDGQYSDPEAFMGYLLAELCKMYHARVGFSSFTWVQSGITTRGLIKNWEQTPGLIPSVISRRHCGCRDSWITWTRQTN